MKTIIILILAVGLTFWLSHSKIILPGIGLIQLSLPAAMCCVIVLGAIFLLIPSLVRSDA